MRRNDTVAKLDYSDLKLQNFPLIGAYSPSRTQKMVKSLKLVDMEVIDAEGMGRIFETLKD
jgi:hypothetical protein